MAFFKTKWCSFAVLHLGAIFAQQADTSSTKPVAIDADAQASTLPLLPSADQYVFPDDSYAKSDAYDESYAPFDLGQLDELFGGRDLDLDKLFADLFADIQSLTDKGFSDSGMQLGAFSDLFNNTDIESLLDQLTAGLGNLNLTNIFPEVSSQIQPVLDAALSCSNAVPELAQPAEACMTSLCSQIGTDVDMGGDMDGNMDGSFASGMGGGVGRRIEGGLGPFDSFRGGLRHLLHGGGMVGPRGMFGPGNLNLNNKSLCTDACTSFLSNMSTSCPDLANLLNVTSIDCSGAQPLPDTGATGDTQEILDPLPEMPVANTTSEQPVLVPLVQPDNPLTGTGVNGNMVAGLPSSSAVKRPGVGGAASGLLLAASLVLLG